MSLLYPNNFKYEEGDPLRKSHEMFMDSSPRYHQQNNNINHQQQQQNSALMRYRSAPSSFFDSLVNGGGDAEDYRYVRSSSPEIDTFLAKYMLPSTCSGDSGGAHDHDLQEFGQKSMKQEEEAETNTTTTTTYINIPQQNGYSNNGSSSQLVYQNLQNNNDNTMDSSYAAANNSMVLENQMQAKMGTGNGSNLIRQNSSPAGLFSNLGVDNGFGVMRDVGCFRGGNGTNGETGPSNSRLSNHMNFSSSGPSSTLMPQIREMGNQNTGTWDDISFNGLKRARTTDGSMFFGLINLETHQNGNSVSRSTSEMGAVEKFLHFQGSIPCKIRAKRGCATHPRSIAERVRRTRISERMRKLQDLFPNMDKQTNTADMLDSAVDYIKDLQKQVQTLTDTKAKCMCSSKQKQY